MNFLVANTVNSQYNAHVYVVLVGLSCGPSTGQSGHELSV